jgi:hypothetical protein
MTYRPVKSVPGLEVTADAEFRYKGKPKKAIYCHTVTGRKATVRIMIMWDAKSHYWQAAKLVAEAWKFGYKDGDRITYSDGDCHNIRADNLILTDDKGYDEYMRRNSVMRADTLEERKQKLQLVIDEATMTLNYFKTLDIKPINDHVKEYLYPCLMTFAMKTLQMGEKKAMEAVPEALGNMYEAIMNGSAVYNYERFCKKQLHHLKKTGRYGEYWHRLIKPVRIEVEQLNLDCLWERYKVTQSKRR